MNKTIKMDTIASLFRVNMTTVCSDTVLASCDINTIMSNYDVVQNLTRTVFRDLTSNTAYHITQLRLKINSNDVSKKRSDISTMQQELQNVVADECNNYQLQDIVDLNATPWFERWKDKFLSMHVDYDHDFIGSNFGVFIILSNKDLQTFDSITGKLLAQVRDNTLLRFMTPSFIEHYIVINTDDVGNGDVQQPIESTDIPSNMLPAYNKFCNCFGQNNCSWINVPRQQPGLNMENFLKNFITISLIPWCERQIKILNQAISMRKGLKRNLVLVTRQLLSMGQTTYTNQSVVYTSDAGEMQSRKLGDIAMCLGLYQLASNSYDQAKREFLNDSAWLYYAGACEAYAAAMYMQSKFQKSQIEKAITTYTVTCKSLQLAIRATILAVDLLKIHSPRQAAEYLITIAPNDYDLLCGLLLEQAAHLLSIDKNMRRSAFHYVLAGIKYGRCSLNKLSLRCLAQFNAPDWNAAMDYVKISTNQALERENRQPNTFATAT